MAPTIQPAYPLDDVHELPPEKRSGATLRAITAHRPKTWAARTAMIEALEQEGTLSPRLIELIRLRITFWTQCRSCAAMRFLPEEELSEGLVCSLERPSDAPDLTDAERAVMGFVDLYAADNRALDGAVYDGLREHFDEGELVEIGAWCAEFYGWGRVVATWRIWDDLPDSFRVPEGDRITPWGHDDALRLPRPATVAR
jgi:alkylhydroperoxidase family enzyme